MVMSPLQKVSTELGDSDSAGFVNFFANRIFACTGLSPKLVQCRMYRPDLSVHGKCSFDAAVHVCGVKQDVNSQAFDYTEPCTHLWASLLHG